MQIFYSALAEEVGATPNSPFLSLLPFAVVVLIFYLIVLRPQNKKIREHSNLINNLEVGDKIITTGGIIGVISKVDSKNSIFILEVAEGINIKIAKNFVSEKAEKVLKK